LSWLGKLFGTEKVINTGVDMLDNAFYTEQEKAEGHIRLLKAYEPFKLAQRFLALIVVPPWVLGQFACFLLSFTDIDLTNAVEILDGKLGMAALTILAFYFAGGAINSLKK
jgi:hypothetical protein